MVAKNERKICDAVARILEERAGMQRSGARTPEKDGQGAPVEYRFDMGKQNYALEHTIIEAYDRQIESGVDFNELVQPIMDVIGAALPKPGVYYVTFPLDVTDQLNRKNYVTAQTAVTTWIREAASKLYARQLHMAPGERIGKDFSYVERVPGMPFELHMTRSLFRDIPSQANGRLFVSRFTPKAGHELRTARLQRALDRKCPKLKRCKEEGATSILILENNDIALTNHILVGDTILPLIAARSDVPDEVFLVDTCVEEWTIFSMIRGDRLWPDGNEAVRYREVNPAGLNEV
jgi:hypothetical protein